MDLDAWIVQLKRCEPLKEAQVKLLCERAIEILVEEGNVQHIEAPVTICESSEGGRNTKSHQVSGGSAHCQRLTLQVATSMASFMTSWSCSRSGATVQR